MAELNLVEILEGKLLSVPEYVSENGKVLKAKVYEDTMATKPELIRLLLSSEPLKKQFFEEVDGVTVFDKQKFAWLLENREFLPDSYTRYKNKIGLSDKNGNLISSSEDVVLSFPYKDCVLVGGQDKDDEKRDEIFFNEIIGSQQITRMLEPKIFTNAKRYTKNGIEENIQIQNDDNLIIKGNNLIALSSLLERYEGKVKCIYIDPPYYFSQDKSEDSFKYNSNFKLSTWLTFMKNRLNVAQNLLSNDGTIFVQISDDGMHYLKILMDDIFGTDRYLNTIVVKAKASSGASGGGEDKKLKKNVEYILIYNKKETQLKMQQSFMLLEDYIQERKEEGKTFAYKSVLTNPGKLKYIGNTVDGSGKDIELYNVEEYETKSIRELAKEEKISEIEVYERYIDSVYTTENAQTSIRTRVKDAVDSEKHDYVIARYVPKSGKNKDKLIDVGFIGNTKRLVSFLKETCKKDEGKIYKAEKVGTLWDDISWSSVKDQGKISDFGAGKKPEILLERIISMATNPSDIVLDFHLGSGTTCAVAHKMGRRYIGIEQMDYIEEISVQRLKNVIQGEQTGISKKNDWNGGGSFVYCELMENANALISIIESATKENIDDIKAEIYADDRILPYITSDELKGLEEEFEKMDLNEKKKALISLVDKNKLYVNYSDIDDTNYEVSEEDKAFTRSFYEEV